MASAKQPGQAPVEMTNGTVQAATQRDAMLQHLPFEYGVDPSGPAEVDPGTAHFHPDLPEALRELLAIRLQASTTSTSKYRALTAPPASMAGCARNVAV